jgi:hypothetical protein
MKTPATQSEHQTTLSDIRLELSLLPEVDRQAVEIFARAYRETSQKYPGAAMLGMALVLAEMSVDSKASGGDPIPSHGRPPADTWPDTVDAREWARQFIWRARACPDMAGDEGAMIGWFANAIMAGYDAQARAAAGKTADEYLAAVAGRLPTGWSIMIDLAPDNLGVTLTDPDESECIFHANTVESFGDRLRAALAMALLCKPICGDSP